MEKSGKLVLLFGTGDMDGAGGIYRCEFDRESGRIGEPRKVASTPNPSFFWKHPDLPVLGAVNELETGTVSFFSTKASGELDFLQTVSSAGSVPCHLEGTASYLAVANYMGPGISIFPLGPDGLPCGSPQVLLHEGSGPNAARQTAPHPHGTHIDAGSGRIFAPDLGTDEVVEYLRDSTSGTFLPICAAKCPPGSGPRHVVFHPNLPLMFVLTELSNEVLVFRLGNEKAEPELLASSSSLPRDFSGTSYGAEITIHPSGRLLLASNRGHDSIAAFGILPDGKLEQPRFLPLPGTRPRHFVLEPDGQWIVVGCQGSENFAVFQIHPPTAGDGSSFDFEEIPQPLSKASSVPSPTACMFL